MKRELDQQQRILRDLLNGRKVTALDALNRHQVFRLSSIIHRLRKAGHDIKTDKVRAASGANHAVYLMKTKPKKKTVTKKAKKQ